MIFLLAGHSNSDPGAVANGVQEAGLTKELRNTIAAIISSKGGNVRLDDDRDNLSQVIRKLTNNESDVICDLHFNAAAAPTATGIEVLVPARFTQREKMLADSLASQGSEVLMIRNRGVKDETQSHRGRLGILHPTGVNVLIEVCFITNPTDLANYQKYKKDFAHIVAAALLHADATNN